MNRRVLTMAVLVALQLLIVGVAVAPRLSAHLRGEEYLLRVAPIDPIDPFRGAYVDLAYPDLQPDLDDPHDNLPEGTIFVPLIRDGDYWKAGGHETERPEAMPYLACETDQWDGFSCGIESWFTDQEEAARLELEVADGAVATIKVDDRGNAAIVALDPEES